MRRSLLLLAFALMPAACESGWDFDGRVITKDVNDKNRQLIIYFVTAKALPAGELPSTSLWYQRVQDEPAIPALESQFHYSDFGCHEGAVVVVAWAPTARVDPVTDGFRPKTGDGLVFSDVRDPYCGFRTHVEHFTLTLTDKPYEAP